MAYFVWGKKSTLLRLWKVISSRFELHQQHRIRHNCTCWTRLSRRSRQTLNPTVTPVCTLARDNLRITLPARYGSVHLWETPMAGTPCSSYVVITQNILGATLRFICIFSLENDPSRPPQFLWSLSKKSVWCWELVMFEICSSHWIITPTIFWKGQHCVAVPAATNCFLFENVLENKSLSGVFSSQRRIGAKREYSSLLFPSLTILSLVFDSRHTRRLHPEA